MNTKTDGISSGLVAVVRQFQDKDGNWHPFIDQRHYENTAADGSWPIRHLVDISDAEAIISAKDAEIRQWRILAHQEHGYVLAENRKQAERIAELEASPISEEVIDILRSTIEKQSGAIKLARSKVYSATICHPNGVQCLLEEALAAIDALGEGNG